MALSSIFYLSSDKAVTLDESVVSADFSNLTAQAVNSKAEDKRTKPSFFIVYSYWFRKPELILRLIIPRFHSFFNKFSENLMLGDFDRLAENEVYEIVKSFDQEFFKLEDILQEAANLLTDLSGCTVVALDVEPSRQRLTAFDIVVLGQHTALAVFTLDESRTVTSQFLIPRNFLQEDLLKLKSIIQERFLGYTVLDIHYKIRTEIPQIIQRYFTTTDNVIDLFEHIFKEMFNENIVVAGKVNLLNFANLAAYQFFDQPQKVALEIREGLHEDQMQNVRVADSQESCLADLAVISSKFLIPYRGVGILAIIGPVNLDYQQLINQVNVVNRVLTMKLTDFYRYLSSNHYEVH